MKPRGPARKVTPEQRHELVQVFLHMGKKVAAEMCVEYGVCRGYAYAMVRELGLLPPAKTRGGGNIAFGVDHKDPRWQRAIERGAVIA